MDLAGLRTIAPEHDAVQQQSKIARRATWAPTINTHLDTSALDQNFLKKAAELASKRCSNTASLASASPIMRDLPPTTRLAPMPEERTVVRVDSHAAQTVDKRHTMHTPAKGKQFASAGSLRNPMHTANVRRWDAKARTTEAWDGLQRDPELFNPAGELLVHLHARGHSRRGPSFRISLHKVHKMRCGPMFTLCFAEETAESRSRRMPGAPRIYEIFIPAPQGMLREDAFTYHLTTRNFFAFLLGKPLVATNLGKALVDLRERAAVFRSEDVDNHESIMEYMEMSGYLSFGHRPDYALAVLQFAEHFRLRDLWIDAFAHCVGMSSILSYSPEYLYVQRRTKTLLNQAGMAMILNLTRNTKAMGNFLEDDLSSSHIGLSPGARSHLDRFRSFLHQHYVEKFGYWPPRKESRFPKAVYRSMYFDFRGLYDYLADVSSSDSAQSQKLASGGICVLQNVQAFDQRHKYASLPHPLPLLPEPSAGAKPQSQRARLSLALSTRSSRASRQYSARTSLHAASNNSDLSIVNAPLVKAYRQFERDCANATKDDKVSIQDARKVRWILIYCTLQTLISLTRAPKEVRDAERSEYPLCCTASCIPPWEDETEAIVSPISPVASHMPEFPRPGTASSQGMDVNGMPTGSQTLTNDAPFEIHPDCETDAGFLAKSRSNSTQSLVSLSRGSEATSAKADTLTPPLLRRNSSKTSQRSIKGLSFASFGTRRNSVVKPPPSTFCEIIVHGYGNGLNPTIISNSPSSSPPLGANKPRTSPPNISLPSTALDMPLSRATQHRPRPQSSYIPSNNSSHTAILAPQPIRPMSAHEKKSFKMPANLTNLNVNVTPEQMRTPTLDISQMDRLKDSMPNLARHPYVPKDPRASSTDTETPVSTSDTTDSDHEASPVWSVRRGSASSQSSAEVAPDEPIKTTAVVVDNESAEQATDAQLQDVGGLLQPAQPAQSSNPARRGILVHRTFSVERFKVPTSTAANAAAAPTGRRVRDQALAVAQKKWRRKSVRYTDEVASPSQSTGLAKVKIAGTA